MKKREIILAKIVDIISKPGFLIKSNGTIKVKLRCSGLNDLYEINSSYLEPY